MHDVLECLASKHRGSPCRMCMQIRMLACEHVARMSEDVRR